MAARMGLIQRSLSHGFLDKLAVSMSIVCAIHCLITPVLLVFMPIITTTFWAHHNFHLWMILFVLPTSTTAIFLGCRRHKDKIVMALSLIGLSMLVLISLYESFFQAGIAAHHACEHCAHHHHGHLFTYETLINLLGGLSLASAHVRNHMLCRKKHCSH